MNDSPGSILDALYKLLIIDHRIEIEKIGGEVLLSMVRGRTLKIVVGVKVPEDERSNGAVGT